MKKAKTISWLEIKKRYAALLTNQKGNVAKPLCLVLEVYQRVFRRSNHAPDSGKSILAVFFGYVGYGDEKLSFDLFLMVFFRKRLTPEILGEINEMIIRDAKRAFGQGR